MDKSYSRYNVVATYGSGKIGNARLYKKGERSYVRAAYNGAKTNPRTQNQMKTRLRWANLGVAWQYLKPRLEKGFEGQTPYRSAFNMWMQVNMLAGNGVYIEKEQTMRRISPLQPFILTKGSVLTGDVTAESLKPTWKTESSLLYAEVPDIVCSVNTNPSSGTKPTRGKVSESLVKDNPWLKEGDMITVVEMQDVLGLGAPGVKFAQFIINLADTTVWNGNEGFVHEEDDASSITLINGIATSAKESIGVIVSRKENGKLLTTTSKMVLTTAAETLRQTFLTQQQLLKAAISYGENQSVFLDPNK